MRIGLNLPVAHPRDWPVLLPILEYKPNYDYELELARSKREVISMLKNAKFPQGIRRNKSVRFRIEVRATCETIGILHLVFDPSYLVAHIGIMIHQPFQNMGYGTESVRGLVRFCHSRLQVQRISAACDTRNVACRKMLEGAGFTYNGKLPYHFFHSERGWVDAHMYSACHPTRNA